MPCAGAFALSTAPASSVPQDLILDKSGKPFKDKTISLAVANSIKRGKNVEAVQIGPNQWGMRPVVDEDVAKVVSINGHQSGQTQQARRAHKSIRLNFDAHKALEKK